MNKPTLYIETTIPSYLTGRISKNLIARARQEITRKWWQQDASLYDMFVSDTVLQEVSDGDTAAARRRLDLLLPLAVLPVTPKVQRALFLFLEHGVDPQSNPDDAAHLAFASAHEIGLLCMWNFRHLANVGAMRRLRIVSARYGLHVPQICTPEELLGE